MKQHQHGVLALAAASLVLVCGVARADGLVIRGGTCSAAAFKAGAELAQDDTITNLSVNCTTASNNKANYAAYTGGIAGANFCVGTQKAVQLAGGRLVTNPQPGHPLHCLLSGKASKLAGVLTRR